MLLLVLVASPWSLCPLNIVLPVQILFEKMVCGLVAALAEQWISPVVDTDDQPME